MGIVRQLYQLQDVELEIESKERFIAQIDSQLGESQVVVRTRAKLASAEQHLEELRHQQNSAEWEIDDLEAKLAVANETLYSGRIKNPKELTNLQHEVEELKTRRDQLEDRALELMEQAELKAANVATISSELKMLEEEWCSQQQKLSADMEQLKNTLSDLKHKRQLILADVDPQVVDFYYQLKKRKGWAVAKVEQGICCGCRISLSTAELQRARGGSLLQCNNCGRILFLD